MEEGFGTAPALSSKKGLSAIKTGPFTGKKGGTGLSGSVGARATGTSPLNGALTKGSAQGPSADKLAPEDTRQPSSLSAIQGQWGLTQVKGAGAKGTNNNSHLGRSPRSVSEALVNPFGSPHDNIFQRITNRMIIMCWQKRIVDCD